LQSRRYAYIVDEGRKGAGVSILPRQPGWWFEDIIIGRTYDFGTAKVTADDIALFHERFAPNLPLKTHEQGREGAGPRAAESHIYALWRRMLWEETRGWPVVQRLGQDALRYYKASYAGEELTVRLSFLAVEDRNETEGVLTASHEVLDQDGLLVMSVMTRTVMAKRPKLKAATEVRD
jgi:acyl dehydratase